MALSTLFLSKWNLVWVGRWQVSSEDLLSNMYKQRGIVFLFCFHIDEVKVEEVVVWLTGPDSSGLFHRDANKRFPSIDNRANE